MSEIPLGELSDLHIFVRLQYTLGVIWSLYRLMRNESQIIPATMINNMHRIKNYSGYKSIEDIHISYI